MSDRSLFDNVSPLDHRYSRGEGFEEYSRYFSERARITYQARVEAALVQGWARRGLCPEAAAEEVARAADRITVEEVYQEEEKTRHDVRGLVNCLQRKVNREVRPLIHLTATSYDIVDTANSLRYQEANRELVIPVLTRLEEQLMEIALREKSTLQIGRTHGQHAVPLTFGFALAEYVSRLGGRLLEIKKQGNRLKGKLSGAVGAYNAGSLLLEDPQRFEEEVLAELGLEPSPHSTQIVEPEFMVDYIHTLVSCFGVLANMADDLRHLQRTEIMETGEYFAEDQVGSSTMPHKRNPINYENVKSMWKQFMPRMMTLYQDQLSEHQRDLTNSASGRFVPEIVIGLLLSARRLTRVLSRLGVDENNLQENFRSNAGLIGAEPLYILLAYHGHPQAHEAVRKLTLEAEESGKTLVELVQNNEQLAEYWQQLTEEQQQVIKNPEQYTGRAEAKTEEIVAYWRQKLSPGSD
ncbi:MAG: lyase family protein [Bacillota bacterium]